MPMTRRTQKEIENDCKRIREAAKNVSSMKELEVVTKLSYQEIKTTLSKHPIIYNRIKEQIAKNKEKAIELEKLNMEKKSKEAKTSRLKAKEDEKGRLEEKSSNAKKSEENTNKDVGEGYVIDASITGIETLRKDIAKICSTKSKIILTSITIKELKKMQEFKDVKADDARFILAQAVEKEENFKVVLIDESYDTPDDCIIQYCAKNKENVILVTSDNEMVLKARMYGIQIHYMKQKPEVNKNSEKTLYHTHRINNKLYIPLLKNNNIEIRVFSNGIEYKEGEAELKIGDDVFIACKKPEYITFAHYKMTSLYVENNCRLVYAKRIYGNENIDMSNAAYKSFLREFKHRLNL